MTEIYLGYGLEGAIADASPMPTRDEQTAKRDLDFFGGPIEPVKAFFRLAKEYKCQVTALDQIQYGPSFLDLLTFRWRNQRSKFEAVIEEKKQDCWDSISALNAALGQYEQVYYEGDAVLYQKEGLRVGVVTDLVDCVHDHNGRKEMIGELAWVLEESPDLMVSNANPVIVRKDGKLDSIGMADVRDTGVRVYRGSRLLQTYSKGQLDGSYTAVALKLKKVEEK